jgi:tripartite-type tricarboxylate transporter receptor subunit TctC
VDSAGGACRDNTGDRYALNSELNGVLGSRNAKEALDAQGVQSEPGQPSAVTERIRADTEKWRAVVAQIGIHSE